MHARPRIAPLGARLTTLTGLVAVLGLTAPATPARAATYYVDPAGSDAGAGTSADPWATLQLAADSVGPGDVVYIPGWERHQFENLTDDVFTFICIIPPKPIAGQTQEQRLVSGANSA